MGEQKVIVENVIKALEKSGVEAWGQVAASRKPAKTISEVATARGVHHVLVVRTEQERWRKFVEGDLAKEVSQKLGSKVKVEGVSP